MSIVQTVSCYRLCVCTRMHVCMHERERENERTGDLNSTYGAACPILTWAF